MTNFQSPATKTSIVRKGAIARPGLATAIGGFQCVTEKGPTVPTKVVSPDDYRELFGDRLTAYPQGYDAMLGFFANEGSVCYINRVTGASAVAASRDLNTVGPAGRGSVTSAVGPFTLADEDTIVVDTESGNDGTITVRADPATLTFTGSWAAGDAGETATFVIPGVPGEQVVDLSSATSQSTYAAQFNSQLLGAKAVVSGSDIVITTDVAGTDAAPAKAYVVGVSGASVTTKTGLVAGAFTNATPGNVANIRAVTADELVTLGLAELSNVTPSNSGGALVLTRDLAGAAATVQVMVASTADTKMGLDNSAHAGTASTSVSTIKVNASSVGVWGNSTKVKATRNDVAVTRVAATAAGATSTISVLSGAKLQVGDQISITKGADTQRAVISVVDGATLTLSTAITVPTGGYAGTEDVVLETWNLYVYGSDGLLLAPSPFMNLRMDPLAGPRYFEVVINSASRTPVTVTALGPSVSDPRPEQDAVSIVMSGGSNGGAIGVSDFIGSSVSKTGVYAWNSAKDVNFISMPGVCDILGANDGASALKGLEAYLELRGDVQGIIEGPSGFDHSAIATWVTNTANFSSMFLTMYWPHVYVVDSLLGVKTLKAPSGWIQGLIARTHYKRNFAKSPAGITDGQVRGIVGLGYNIDEGSDEYDGMFSYGINAIINFPGEGYAVWGDKTLDSTNEYGVHGEVTGFCVARRELKRRTRFVNFEPNNEDTRSQVVRVATSLFRQWRKDGILKGSTDEEAFFIICDDTNNTAQVIAAKKMKIRVGLAFDQPARYVDITLEQDTRALEASLASQL